jgi:hypothetical protein
MAPTKKPRKRSLGEILRKRGFDLTEYDRRSGYYRPRCSCCQVLVIQGIACHERGCSNEVREEDEDADF